MDGELEGYAGLMYTVPMQAFSHLSDRIKKAHPIGVFKAGKKLVKMIEEVGVPVYAKADKDEPTASTFLTRLGFERLDEDTFVWNPSQQD